MLNVDVWRARRYVKNQEHGIGQEIPRARSIRLSAAI
jgi:hypothetical protein